MSEFPSLAEVLADHMDTIQGECSCRGFEYDYYDKWAAHVADAWRDACTITTVEQIAALPDGSTVRDAGDLTWQRIDDFADDDHPDGWICVLDGDEPIELPALLIWHPDWARP